MTGFINFSYIAMVFEQRLPERIAISAKILLPLPQANEPRRFEILERRKAFGRRSQTARLARFHHTERIMAIVSFEIVSVPVADQERSKIFYQNILGFNLLREESMGPSGGKWIQLAPPGCTTTIALVTWFDTMKPGGLQGVMLNSSDIDGDHRLLSSRGLQLSNIEQQPWGRYTMFKDPDGNGWILRQRPAS
jgi:catechol 2,3-dioxygenase-like lactoylglutathione lyase family enzyme